MKKSGISKIQKQFWILNEIYPDSGAYNLFSVFRLSKPLNYEYLQVAVRYVIDRHEALRTSFGFSDNELFQYIKTPEETEITVSEVQIDEFFDEKDVHRAIYDEVNGSFDLSRSPVCRITVFTFRNNISVLAIVFHHIIVDVRSEGIFSRELSAVYNSLVKNQEIKLETVAYQYSDYIDEITPWYSSDDYRGKLGALALESPDPNAVIKLPGDNIETGGKSAEGSGIFVNIDKQLTEKVKQFSDSNKINPYRFFLAAYAIFLHRLSNQEKICIGLPLTNRTRPVSKSTFGCFINALPLQVDFSEEKSCGTVLEEVSASLSRLLDRQEIPFPDLVTLSRHESNTTVNPYFQTGFSFKPPMQLSIDGVEAVPLKVTKKDNQNEFDFYITLYPEGECFGGYAEYSGQLFRRETVLRWIEIYKKIVIQLIESPEITVSNIDILTEEDRKELTGFNSTESSFDDLLIQNLFEKQAGLTPLKRAVVSGGRILTYKELDDQSNQLANHLAAIGVVPGDFVGVCLERTVDMVVSVFGIHKAGCCYLPLDPSFPDDRLSYMYEDSGAKVLISQSSLKDKFRQFPDTSIVLTDTDRSIIKSLSSRKPGLNISTQSLAYIIYTSGSTGKPKGVKVHHQAVVNFLNSMSKKPGITSEDKLLAVTTLSFDISVLEVFLPLSFGAELVIADTEDIFDGRKLAGLLDQHDITLMQATPATWNILLGSGWKGKKNLKALCGGEAILPGLIKELLPGVATLWDMYGPTETTVWSTCNQLTDSEPPILIGKPIDNTTVYILGRNKNQLPVGVTGEVCIGGAGVTKGYHKRPELTAEKFITFENGEIIYRTGDLGRYLSDGNIELFGRSDNQIKLRGFRIEPGEIESLLSRLPGVKEAVVKIHKFGENDERLVAFLNADPEIKLTSEDITGSLSQHLPGYMIPSFFQITDGFPRLPNGKINKKALIFELQETEEKREIVFDSLTETQKKLINIWEDILKIRNVTPVSNFFDIGGSSFLAIRILNKIKEDLGVTISFKAFIAQPTINQTGSIIDSQSQIQNNSIELTHHEGRTNLPLTLNQKRLWLISTLQPDISSYIISFTYKFSGSLNFDIFQKSLEILFHRHHIIFSVIKEENGEPYCDIVPSDVKISFTDHSGLAEKERSEKVNEILDADSMNGFDLENGPLYRLYLIKTGITEYYFRFSIHHIIFDAWSWSVLVKDLNEIYNSQLEGKNAGLDELEFQQYDYAQWEKGREGSKDEDKSKEFWRENLSGSSPMLNFPYDYQRREKPTGRGRYETIQLSPELSEKLRKLSKAENSSLFATILSAFAIQLQKYSGEDDINIGLPVAFRPHSKLENIFGMFVNTVVVRLKYSKEFTIRKIIHQTNEAALNAIAHQELPFETIVGIVNPERSSTANPLFQVGFVWQHNLDIPITLDGVRSEKITGRERPSIFDITMYLWENGDKIEGEIEYNLDILKTDTIIRLRDNFIHLVESVAGNPDQTISEISIVSESDKKKLKEFNRTEVEIPDYLIQDFFENQVKKTPLKRAVICGESSLTYQELDNQSNQMARHLKTLGVTNGDIVGICLERSVDMVVSVLGILKAGCCYLPLDPSFPDDRLSYMYEDSGAKVLISQSSLKEKFRQFPNTSIVLADSDRTKITGYSPEKPDLKLSNQSLAYIIYTSGSTGKPKGVKVHHQAVVNFLNSMSKKPGITAEARLLAVTTLSFDISVLELFLPLSNGAELFIADVEDISDGQKLSGLLDLYDITLMQATPATWNILLDSVWKGKKNMKALCGGEAILPGLVKDLLPLVESLWDMYGPTETTVWSTCNKLTDSEPPILIGTPIDNTTIYILDKNNNQLPVGVTVGVRIGGMGVTKGYHNRPELTAEKFIPYENGQIIYKTGDLGRFLADGNIELFGRSDNQIKLRGFRIEPGEIENLLSRLSGVKEAVVKVHRFDESDERLVAFLNADAEFKLINEEITRTLSQNLPAYMIPSFYQVSDGFPRLPNGKINKKALLLKVQETEVKTETEVDLLTETQKKLMKVWKNVLKTSSVGLNTNFFEAGGTSVLIPRIIVSLKKEYNISIKSVNIFEYSTVKSLAEFISASESGKSIEVKKGYSSKADDGISPKSRDIAVIGMAGCFPGSDNIDQFWDFIKSGKEAVTFFTREELKNKGVAEVLLDNPDYVYANSIISRAEMFDSAFFEISPREADFMDPQHRLFLEVCYEALENSGYAPRTGPRNVGVFAGTGINNYLLKSLIMHPDALRSVGEFQTMINSDKDFLTTRVSYKLNLTGPSMDIQTACSTSLVAIHIACQSLYNNECEMALSGGVSIQFPRGNGYMYKKGGILSPTGHCRPFDEKADGTVLGEGAGVILLKRLEDAVRDKDNIYAVIKSTAINNDGSVKVGYMAPSLEGQARVIRQAQDQAGISPETITFIETHGTGTKLGDPIEIGALKKVFPKTEGKDSYCALGAVKANIGHLDIASGVAGVIKTILALKNKQIPPLTNFMSFNQDLDIENSAFYVTKTLKDWQTDKMPRRGAVSSFGIGGTNAHCIIEEWQPAESEKSGKVKYFLMPISAMSQVSLDKLNEKYITFFESTSLGISDIAYTMQHGREFFKFRQMFVADSLKERSHIVTNKGIQLFEKPRTVFMFTGQGSQYRSMSRGLYDNFLTFRKYIDSACEILKKQCDVDLHELLFASETTLNINETNYAQPALVAVQYATAKLLEEFGIKPDMLIGHSIGELTAACISGVFSFEDILVLSARRGKIMHEQTRGSMLSVNLPENELRKILIPGIEISLINAPEYCVVSGTDKAISDFKEHIAKTNPGLQTVILKTSHAFHSELMDPAIAPFRSLVEKTVRKEIHIPFISNTSGILIRKEEAQSAEYWSDHIRKPVNFAMGVSTLLENQTIFLEVGPGSTLTSLLSQFKSESGFKAIPTLRGAKQETDDVQYFLSAISQYWITGGEINWSESDPEPHTRVSVPTYAFNRKRNWVDTKSSFNFDYNQASSGEETYNIDYIEDSSADIFDRSGFTEEFIGADTEIQKVIVKIWEDYLGVKGIGIIDDFFSLGGHSLLASQVINKVNEHYKIDLPLETIFRTPTVEKLEKVVDEARKNTTLHLNLQKIKNTDYLPVSNEQKRLWTINQIDNNPAYNIPFTYKFKGKFNDEIFSQSINAVFDRHDILRGRFAKVDNEPVMILDKKSQVHINRFDFSDIPEEEKEKRIEQLLGEDIRKPFDIEREPLYRLYLIKTGTKEVIFHMTVHHIVFDGWSWGVFVSDLKKAYIGLLQNQGVQFSGDVNQYCEYAQWQKSNISEQKSDKSIKYWKEKLNGHNGMLNFPYDFPRKEMRSGLGGKEYFRIDPVVRSELKKLAKNLNVTDFMIYISAFSILLNKYSNDEDICIGIPSANRPSYQLEEIIGFFVNTLVLRFRLNEKSTFKEYLAESKKVIIEALEHQDLPFEKVVDVVQAQRAVSSNPIFQVAFAWLNTPSEIFEFPDVSTERITVRTNVAPLDISVYLWEDKGCIEGEIEYSIDLLKRDTVLRLKNNFLNLIKALGENSGTAIESISMISDEEKKYLDAINDTKTDYPKEKTIIRLFEDQVNLYPDKTAVVFKEESLSYKQLNEKANQLARTLRENGVVRNSPVGILAEKSLEMVIGILGILKAGGGYVPIDPEYPGQRIDFIIKDSGCRVLVTIDKFMDADIGDIRKVSLNSAATFNSEKSDVENINASSDLAYIMYTSGTTGLPKGTPIHQQGVVRLVRNTNYIEFKPEDRILLAGALVFDATTFEIWGALLNGGMLFIIDKETLLNPDMLGEELKKDKITILLLTSSLFTQIAESRSDIFNNVKYLLVGGDVLSVHHINKVRRDNPQLKVINAYGPTENSCISTCYTIDRDYENNIPIGKPISNSTTYIFDKNMNYQPVGIIGELYVGGDGVSMGYLNRDDLNIKSFLAHPYIPGERLYRTGDYAMWLPEGNIEFHGRMDNQLKIRGFRVELGEIESVISDIEGVIETVIKPLKIEEGDYKLVAFLNVPETFKMDIKEISSRVKVKLPSYMVPSAYKLMHGFPKTINGKIDKKALNFDLTELKNKSGDENGLLTTSEKIIHEIWCEALKTKDISTTDNFFDIGGNSLLAINLVNLISKAFNTNLKTFMIFEYPTIKDQSEYLDGKNIDKLSLKNIKIDEKIQRKKNVNFRKHRE